MKILLDHSNPFLLAHGGFQIQIEQTKGALEQIGVEVEFLRWWDDQQRGNIIHYFGRPEPGYVEQAHQKGIQVVVSELLTAMGSRALSARRCQKLLKRTAQTLLPRAFTERLAWRTYQLADALVALTSWEAFLMGKMFDAPPERIHCVPNGVEEVFLRCPAVPRGQWLVCTATIAERKRVLELSEAAVAANTPLWILGKPYSDASPYARRFLNLAQAHPGLLRYEGPLSDRAKLACVYREARGFVLLSTMESLSLSALEAAACECPLLLSDLSWARSVFDQNASYCPITSVGNTAKVLRQFYDRAPSLKPPPKPATWLEVALQLKAIYERLLSTSR